MTPDEAKQKLDALFQAFGEPHYALFHDLWQQTTAAMVAEYRSVGDAAFAQMFADALAAVRTLAEGSR